MAEPPYGVIWNRMKVGKVVPFLGAGASLVGRPLGAAWAGELSPFLPTGGELSGLLAEETSFPEARPEDRSDLARVASYYVDVNGRPVLRERLHQILCRDCESGSLHEFLASLDTPQVIVSTNYDTLLERAFLAAKRPFDLVVYPSDNKEYANSVLWWPHGKDTPTALAPNQLDIDLDATTVIFKMHGTVDRDGGGKWDNYVITEEDYVEFLSRMTTNAAIPAIFFDYLVERSLLFLGYSLKDWNLRVILKNLGLLLARSGRGDELPSWAIQKQSSELERMLWKSRKVSIYDLPIDELVRKLVDRRQA
jgi:hypothetical protein